jgi:hypothetical protein
MLYILFLILFCSQEVSEISKQYLFTLKDISNGNLMKYLALSER